MLSTAISQDAKHKYFIKNSEVELPDGVEWGQYKRTIQPFENWVLICDENLKKHERICNITQIIINASGEQVFSWSLAATLNGEPLMILRTPGDVDQKIPIMVKFADNNSILKVTYNDCSEAVCVAMMPVSPLTREHIDKESNVKITFTQRSGNVSEIIVPLKGLKSSLEGMK